MYYWPSGAYLSEKSIVLKQVYEYTWTTKMSVQKLMQNQSSHLLGHFWTKEGYTKSMTPLAGPRLGQEGIMKKSLKKDL